MKIKVHTLNSFVKDKNGGNRAGVVMNAGQLKENEMKKIASIVGFSETAFIMKSELADFRIRFFTPEDEVDLCGHATVASFYLLSEMKIIVPGEYLQNTKAGTLNVEVNQDGKIYMNQVLPRFLDAVDRNEAAGCLRIHENDLIQGMPVQIVSTGLKDIIVPVKSLETLLDIKPDHSRIEELSKKYGVIGMHVFSLESVNESTAHCRNFSPACGIPEESATGTSNGALACYLYKHGKIRDGEEKHLVFEQGYSMDLPSEILAKISLADNNITGIQVGGTAEITGEIEVEI